MKIFITSLLLVVSLLGWSQQNETYTVKKGETLESIAKRKRISPSDILRLNPDIKGEVTPEMILVLPKSQVTHFNSSEIDHFLSHTVQKQETLFELTRRYGISMDDIKRYNQVLYERNLRTGEILTIPVFKKSKEILSDTSSTLKKYIVQAGDGIWRVAKSHHISVEELLHLNPGISKNLQEGQTLWIPEKSVTEDVNKEEFATYTAEKAEGFYSLKRKFGLSREELIAINPHLKDGVQLGTEIRIPLKNYQKYLSSQENEILSKETETPQVVSDHVFRIAYVLPFKLDENLSDKAVLKEKLQNDIPTQIASDFYMGARLALDSLYTIGYRFDAYVFDSQGNSDTVKVIPSESFQAIIGPFLPKVLNTLSQKTDDSTKIFAPFSNGDDIQLRANVYQTLPSVNTQKQAMLTYLKEHFKEANVLILSDASGQKNTSLILQQLPGSRTISNSKPSIDSFLQKGKENIVIINTSQVAFLVQALQNLAAFSTEKKGYNIRLVTLDKSAVFDDNNISVHQLSQLRFTFPSPNRFSNRSTLFSQQFEKQFGTTPNRYIIRGFDLTMDVIQRLNAGHISSGETSHIESKFDYQNNPYRGEGMENKGVYILEYNHLEIKELK